MNEDGIKLNESVLFGEDSIEYESTESGMVYGAGKVEGDELIPDQSEVAALQTDSRKGATTQHAQMPELTPMLSYPFLEQRRQARVTDGRLDGWNCK